MGHFALEADPGRSLACLLNELSTNIFSGVAFPHSLFRQQKRMGLSSSDCALVSSDTRPCSSLRSTLGAQQMQRQWQMPFQPPSWCHGPNQTFCQRNGISCLQLPIPFFSRPSPLLEKCFLYSSSRYCHGNYFKETSASRGLAVCPWQRSAK